MLRLIAFLALTAGAGILVVQYGSGQLFNYSGIHGTSYLATTIVGAVLLIFAIVALGKSGSQESSSAAIDSSRSGRN